jgi:hypothetical protein
MGPALPMQFGRPLRGQALLAALPEPRKRASRTSVPGARSFAAAAAALAGGREALGVGRGYAQLRLQPLRAFGRVHPERQPLAEGQVEELDRLTTTYDDLIEERGLLWPDDRQGHTVRIPRHRWRGTQRPPPLPCPVIVARPSHRRPERTPHRCPSRCISG